MKIKKKKYFFFFFGGGGGGGGRVRGRIGGGVCHGGWEWRIEAFVKIPKKKILGGGGSGRGGGGGGGGGGGVRQVGGSGWM